ncbi:organic cation transporter protein-like isoform X2 [Onthophagus taurus]|uniref:organic cation transporter protein-like isoform X2 n=1 Tax=Onthophagus taurus TaxID=166361 RepID=UPI0039BE8E9E
MTVLDDNLDNLLVQIGEVGKYQLIISGLVSLAVIWQTAIHMAFVFTSQNIDHRCLIPECDQPNQNQFEPDWLKNSVPYDDGLPKKCERYQHINITDQLLTEECPAVNFDQNVIENCEEFVYKSPEKTILHAYNLFCDDNLWKLTLVGTINTLGQFFSLIISGIVSDKLGRKFVLIWGMVGGAIFGTARAFAPNYIVFTTLEFLDALFQSGTYATGFVLAVELVGPKKRVLAGTLICCCFALGEVLAAAVAWLSMDWKITILVLYVPIFLIISYQWLIPESVRWLLSQKRYKEAEDILMKAARINGRTISKHALEKLTVPVDEVAKEPFFHVFKSRILVMRFFNSCFCWLSCAFLFYGLTLNAVSLAGNSYVDFILTSLVEIPAYIATYITVDRFGRRWTQSLSFFITAVACFAYIFISKDQHVLALCFYLLGKFGATAAFTICYIISSEIFPTPLRHSLMGGCSMIARIGSMVSPQMPLLEQLWKPLPLVLFTGMAAIAGLLTLAFPETLNTKLPDTIEEAENIGKKPQKIP